MRPLLFASLLSLAACGQGGQRDSLEPVAVLTPKQVAAERVADLSEAIAMWHETCEKGPSLSSPSNPMDEVDLAMADNIDNISPDEEQRIRASLGAEMGLAPSEVNGWKDIYRSRAQQAQGRKNERERAYDTGKREACERVAQLEAELSQIKGGKQRAAL